jgi:hypothetical protein
MGIFIIAIIGLGVIRSQQVNQQNQLNEKLTATELKLNGFQIEQLSHQQEELEEQLNQTLAQSETARNILSQPTGSIATSSLMFDIAEANNVEITEINSSGLTSGELAGIACSSLPVTASVAGNVTDLVNFVARLNGDLENGVINSVEISVPEAADEEASASIQLVIYAYQGE